MLLITWFVTIQCCAWYITMFKMPLWEYVINMVHICFISHAVIDPSVILLNKINYKKKSNQQQCILDKYLLRVYLGLVPSTGPIRSSSPGSSFSSFIERLSVSPVPVITFISAL